MDSTNSRILFLKGLILVLSLVVGQTYAIAVVPAGSSGDSASRVARPPIVDLGFAKYQGFTVVDNATKTINTNFLGMRYAAPPTGIHRFAAPRKPAATPGVQLANVGPNTCIQAGDGNQPTSPFRVASRAVDATPVADEDCLFINVYLPGDLGEKKNLPVVFWIHGGGYAGGSASQFNGNDLLRDAGGGVVAVIIQYRLGLFGFLPGQKVKDGGALNAGLLDQQLALQWVQEHITKFGGDPSQVTIWGESAGAGSVLQHIVANGGNTNPPLFRAGISSSQYLPSQYNFNDRIPETLYSEVVSQTKCSSSKDTLACLRAADSTTLQTINTAIAGSGFFGTFVFVPVVDGTFITDRPTQILKRGKLNGEILYAVTNAFEGRVFVNQSTTDTVPQYVSQLFPDFGPAEVLEATKQYAGLGDNLFQIVAIMGESIFICPTYAMLRAFGGKAFKTEFAVPPGNHGDDVSYYFFSQNANGIPAFGNPQFDKAFAQSFLDFVLTLDLNKKFDKSNITPLFKLWEGSNEMLFNETEAGAPVIQGIKTSSALLERCNFWDSVTAFTPQ